MPTQYKISENAKAYSSIFETVLGKSIFLRPVYEKVSY